MQVKIIFMNFDFYIVFRAPFESGSNMYMDTTTNQHPYLWKTATGPEATLWKLRKTEFTLSRDKTSSHTELWTNGTTSLEEVVNSNTLNGFKNELDPTWKEYKYM